MLKKFFLVQKNSWSIEIMVYQFRFPDVGEGIAEGKLVKWKVKAGDVIKEDAALADVETAKALVEIPSPKSGTILQLHATEGQTIHVGDVLVTIGEAGETVASAFSRRTWYGYTSTFKK